VSKSYAKILPTGNRRSPGKALSFLSLILLFAGCTGFALLLIFNSRATATPALNSTQPLDAPDEFAAVEPQGDFSVFPHGNAAHSRLTCLLCHRRETSAPQPKLPGHTPCAGCHAQEMNNTGSNICNICHTDRQSGAVKAFPPLKSFNVRFDHGRHTVGMRQACINCHKTTRRGVGFSIPSRLNAHVTCYQCHSPRAQASDGRDISSCSTCHQLGRLARTSENARAYRVNFSHADHGARQRLNCASCHNVRAGASTGQQVTAPVPQMHHISTRAQSCMSCHNDRRAFGTENFANCKRCHEGNTFRFSFFAPLVPEGAQGLMLSSVPGAMRSHALLGARIP
jgi:c(7)-type cytochrome triheme protein